MNQALQHMALKHLVFKHLARWLCLALMAVPLGLVAAPTITTTTTLSSAANPVTVGVPVLLSVSVTGNAPTGTVSFYSSGSVFGGAVALSGTGNTRTATLSYPFVYAGSKSLTAVYSGDATNLTSTSAAVAITANKGSSTTALTSSVNPSLVGGSTTLSATVTGSIVSGSVTFKDGATTLGTGTIASGVATYATTALTAGAHSLTAVYAGDANNNPSTSSVLTQTVNATGAATASTTTLSSAANPVTVGVPVLLSVSVTGNAPTGTVSFYSSGSVFGGAVALSGTGNTRTATLSYPFVYAGSKSLTAVYSGDATNLTSTSAAVAITANKGSPTTALSSSVNPSLVGGSTTLSATVTGSIVSGSVTFKDGATTLGTGTIASGVATYATTALTSGAHSLTAVYAGDANNNTSTSTVLTQTVNAALGSINLAATPNPVIAGQSATLTATLTGNNPTGSVTFKDGATTLAPAVTLSGGVASLSLSTLALGSHNLTAVYAGDANNPGVTSAVAVLLVNAAGPGTMTWKYGYDAMGRPTSTIDPNGLTTYTYYDSLGRPIQTQQPANVGSATPTVTGLSYNLADNLTQVTDPRNLATTYSPNGLGSVTAQSSPDAGASQATFDAKGRLKTSTDARGKLTTLGYDALDRLTSVSYPTGVATTLEYDGGLTPTPAARGELTKVTDESGTTSYTYDSLGRLIGKTQVTNGKSFTLAYAWGNSGSAMDKLIAITYPSGSRINYSYDAQGYLSGVTANPVNTNGVGVNTGTTLPLLSGLSYNADNNVKGWTWSNGTACSISYDSFGLVSGYSLGNPAGTGVASGVQRTLVRDAAGRITGFTHTNGAVAQPALSQSFGYDNLNRLLSATLGSTSASTTTQYSYDANGNRTAKSVGASTYTNTLATTSNRLVQTQDVAGSASVVYDAAGNVTGDGSNTFTYSDRGRMKTATNAAGTVTYLYNGMGLRVAKTGPTALIPTGAAYFVYDESGQLLGEYDAAGTPIYETAYLGSVPVGVLKQTGTAAGANITTSLYNVHADHLATARIITRQSDQAIVWRWDTAEAFGGSAANQNPNSLGLFAYNPRFPGQVFDAETGLNQNWHREYDPRQGRYRQSDPIGLAGGINTFGYVEGNPLSFSDPFGLKSRHDPSGRVCQDHKNKISNYKTDINKRIRELAANPGVLPYYPPYPGAPARASQQGHEDLVRDLRDQLSDREKKYKDDCEDNDPPPPSPPSAPVCGDNCKQVLKQVRDAVTGAIIFTLVLICATS
jgi:RHS repeat-associated protein